MSTVVEGDIKRCTGKRKAALVYFSRKALLLDVVQPSQNAISKRT